MSLHDHALIAFTLIFAAFVHGAVGFGSALVAVAGTTLILGVRVAVPFVAPYSMLIAAILLWNARNHVNWHHFAYPAAGTILGVPGGVFLLKSLNPHIMETILGIFMIVFVFWSILWRGGERIILKHAGLWGSVSGFVGGIFGGAIAAPGPPVVMFVSLTPWSKETMRGAIQAYLLFTYVLAILLFGGTGMMNRNTLLLNLYHLPGVILGMTAGQALFDRIPRLWFIRGVLAVLAVTGITLCR